MVAIRDRPDSRAKIPEIISVFLVFVALDCMSQKYKNLKTMDASNKFLTLSDHLYVYHGI